jgi:hypothetical protein
MTRYLSLALGATEPMFGQSIAELERAGGAPKADIRLSSELTAQVRDKITQLGLDPSDTTGPELYQALHGRMQQDEGYLRAVLHIAADASANDVIHGVQKFLTQKEHAGTCFAMKATVAKKLLKKKAPKVTMKALGYRSLDSMLKHEQASALLAAATLLESATWHRQLRDQYAKLKATDFEQRRITVVYPQTKRWTVLGEKIVEQTKHNIMMFKEMGAVVILPIPQAPDGLAITTTLLSLHYMNDIRSYSSFVKLQQVKPDFGKIVQRSALNEPMTGAQLAGQAVPWRVIQRYYGRLKALQHPDVFEPHVQSEDLQWKDAEEVLASLTPALSFWQGTQYACLLHESQPISLNILDVALSYCNHLSFADRVTHFMREHLWHELMTRYLHQDNLEAAVHQQLSRELAGPQAVAEFA